MTDYFRYPHIPHIAWLGVDAPRDDKLLSPTEVAALLSVPVVVEEKMDGANLGFSAGSDGQLRAQNRGQYLSPPYAGQFRRVNAWLALHGDRLHAALGHRLMAFGEWCAARHSLDYPALPDWWLLFDVYDRSNARFWSTTRRDQLAAKLGLAAAPCIAHGKHSLASLENLVNTQSSRYRNGPMEGIVVRRQSSDWLLQRAKLVRRGFTQTMAEHWRRRPIEWNQVDWRHRGLDQSPNSKEFA